jgi:hypothetical protein
MDGYDPSFAAAWLAYLGPMHTLGSAAISLDREGIDLMALPDAAAAVLFFYRVFDIEATSAQRIAALCETSARGRPASPFRRNLVLFAAFRRHATKGRRLGDACVDAAAWLDKGAITAEMVQKSRRAVITQTADFFAAIQAEGPSIFLASQLSAMGEMLDQLSRELKDETREFQNRRIFAEKRGFYGDQPQRMVSGTK